MKEWIITSNLNRFDVIGAFKKFYKIEISKAAADLVRKKITYPFLNKLHP